MKPDEIKEYLENEMGVEVEVSEGRGDYYDGRVYKVKAWTSLTESDYMEIYYENASDSDIVATMESFIRYLRKEGTI